MTSIFSLMEVAITAPNHTTLSRRAQVLPSIAIVQLPQGPLERIIDSTGLKIYGVGEWLQEKHQVRARRSWRKLHLAIDANTGMIVASTLTETDAGDPTYQTIAAHGEHIKVIIPPRADAVLSDQTCVSPSQRYRHIATIAVEGRLKWQEETGYGRRSLVETTMGRYKAIIGSTLCARCLAEQCIEAVIGVAVLNSMLQAGRPNFVRCAQKSA